MNYRRHASGAALAVLLLVTFAAAAAPALRAQGQDVPRKPRGPAAGPIIRLPRGEGTPAEEQQAEGQKAAQQAAPQKWEYCSIIGHTYKQREVGLSTRSIPTAVIHFFPSTTEEVEGATHDLAVANALAKLGDDGWELVAIRESFRLNEGTGSSAPVFYLKRPKKQE